jgi:hypothetical protein
VTWQGYRCYIVGGREGEALISCPAAPPPRNRFVPRTDRALVPLNTTESIFAAIPVTPPAAAR